LPAERLLFFPPFWCEGDPIPALAHVCFHMSHLPYFPYLLFRRDDKRNNLSGSLVSDFLLSPHPYKSPFASRYPSVGSGYFPPASPLLFPFRPSVVLTGHLIVSFAYSFFPRSFSPVPFVPLVSAVFCCFPWSPPLMARHIQLVLTPFPTSPP